jgi:cytochrome oxidase assembly protein ShyY1
MRLASAPDGTAWPRVMNYPEHADLERVLDRPLGQRIVRLDPAQPDGYERTFAMRPDFGPNRHIAYAVQWFALAVAMLVIYVLVNLKRKHDDSRSGRSSSPTLAEAAPAARRDILRTAAGGLRLVLRILGLAAFGQH